MKLCAVQDVAVPWAEYEDDEELNWGEDSGCWKMVCGKWWALIIAHRQIPTLNH